MQFWRLLCPCPDQEALSAPSPPSLLSRARYIKHPAPPQQSVEGSPLLFETRLFCSSRSRARLWSSHDRLLFEAEDQGLELDSGKAASREPGRNCRDESNLSSSSLQSKPHVAHHRRCMQPAPSSASSHTPEPSVRHPFTSVECTAPACICQLPAAAPVATGMAASKMSKRRLSGLNSLIYLIPPRTVAASKPVT